MRGLCWMVGIVAVAVGVYLAGPPRWSKATGHGTGGTVVRSEARSLVVRLAKAGQAMREGVAMPEGATNSFAVP